MRSFIQALMLILPLIAASVSFGHAGPRIRLFLDGDVLRTGNEFQNDDDTITVTPGVSHVYSRQFSNHATHAASTDFPGFAGPLPDGSKIRFNVLDALGYWNSTSDIAFGTTGGETMRITRSTNVARTSTGPVAGYEITTAGAIDSGWHAHLRFSLDANDNNVPDAIPGEPGYAGSDDGVYLLMLEVLIDNDQNGFADLPGLKSDPFYIVFGKGVSDDTLGTAATWVQQHLVPEPGTLAIAVTSGLLLLTRRRRAA